jgi:hypothetical protein
MAYEVGDRVWVSKSAHGWYWNGKGFKMEPADFFKKDTVGEVTAIRDGHKQKFYNIAYSSASDGWGTAAGTIWVKAENILYLVDKQEGAWKYETGHTRGYRLSLRL